MSVPRLVAVAIVAAMGGWIATSILQQDLAAYFTAGTATARGLDPYVNHLPTGGGPWDGVATYTHSRFLYAPLVAELFRPLAALPYGIAKALFTAASVAALFGGLALVVRSAAAAIHPAAAVGMARTWTWAWPQAWAWIPLGWAVWPPVFLTIERGQIDLLLLAVLAGAWCLRGRPIIAGSLLAVAALGKPAVLALVPLMLVARRYRWAAATASALVLLVALNVAVAGRARFEQYVTRVLPRAALYGEGGPEALLLDDAALADVASDLEAGVARMGGRQSRPYAQTLGTFARNASLPRALAVDGAAPSSWVSLVLFGALALPLAAAARRVPDSFAWYWGGLLAGVVAAPVSWAMELVWALPLLFGALASPLGRSGGALPVIWWLTIGTWVLGFVGLAWAPAWILVALAAVATATTVALTTPAVAPRANPK